MDLYQELRSLIRKDLTSTSYIPTGKALQLLMSEDVDAGFLVLVEASLIRLSLGHPANDCHEYLVSQMLVESQVATYVISSAARLGSCLAENNLNERKTYKELITDPGADPEMVRKLIAMGIEVINELNEKESQPKS